MIMFRAFVYLAILGQALSAQAPPEERWPWSAVAAVRPGEEITVQTSQPKKKIKGRFISSGDAGIRLLAAAGEETVSRANVRSITTKRSVRNAVLAGAVAGVGVYAIFAPRSDFVASAHLVFGAAFAGIGALTGWGLGMAGRTKLIYRAP